MIVRIVKLTLDKSRIADFVAEFNNVKESIRSFEGCRHNELLSAHSPEGVVFTYSKWNSVDDLEKYRQSDLFKTTWAKVKPMFSSKAEAWTLNSQEEF